MIIAHPIVFPMSGKFAERTSGLGHLLSAAVISPQFQRVLLEDPQSALQDGYLGSGFDLSTEERERVLSAQAHSLAELVKKLATV